MEILILIFLITLNGLFAMAEIAFVSSRKLRLEERAAKGNAGAKTALKLMKEPEAYLSAIQVGITLIGIFAGAYGGVALSEDLEPVVRNIEPLSRYSQEIAFTLVVIIITYFSLIIGELVPKSIALNNPEKITTSLAPFMQVFIKMSLPVVKLLSFSTKLTLKLLFIKPKSEPPFSEEELRLLIDQGAQHGILELKENEMLKSILRFADRKAHSVMTNRVDVMWFDIEDDREVIKQGMKEYKFSRYLICRGSIDNVAGVLSVKDFYSSLAEGDNINIEELLSQPLVVPENLPVLRLLEQFRASKTYFSIVVDEYGSTQGIITLHDMIESIFGILPEKFEEDVQIYKREDESLLIDGSLQVDELKEILKIEIQKKEFNTLGGFMMYMLNKIPSEGDKFEYEGYSFEVMDMDNKRVDKVLVKKIIIPE